MVRSSQPPGLTDTNILIDDARGVAAATAFIATLVAGGELIVSAVSAIELVQGCKNAAALAQVQQFLQRATVLHVDTPTSRRALHLMETYFLSHGLLMANALIAATALEHNLALSTRDLRDFAMIPGLVLLRPY